MKNDLRREATRFRILNGVGAIMLLLLLVGFALLVGTGHFVFATLVAAAMILLAFYLDNRWQHLLDSTRNYFWPGGKVR